ncbi:MAG TPA: WG repeat-containing protein [Flavobacteriales bacterium]|nr:WG repeat-containing protein [Flavobacteriales bacterium]
MGTFYLTRNMIPCKKEAAFFIKTNSRHPTNKKLFTTFIQTLQGDSAMWDTYTKGDTLRQGTFLWFYIENKRKKLVTYENGKMHGPYAEWNYNYKHPVVSGNYINDKREGTWKMKSKHSYRGMVNEFYKNSVAIGDAQADTSSIASVMLRRMVGGEPVPYYGCINQQGKVVIPIEYENCRVFGKMVWVRKNGKKGYVDKHNKSIIPIEYDELGPNQNDFIKARKNDKWGYLRSDGQVQIPVQFDLACNFTEYNKAMVKIGKGWYTIDNNGKKIDTASWEYTGCEENIGTIESTAYLAEYRETPAGNRYMLVPEKDSNGKWGVTDQEKNWVVPPEFDEIGCYYNGMIMVKQDGKYGFYTDRGECAVKPVYEAVDPFGGYNW